MICGFALQQGTTISALQRAGAVGISEVFGGAPESSKMSRCFADVINQYFNPTEEPHKPGTKEKRKKAASFQTVSQLHKVRASPSSKAMREACSEGPSISPTSLPRLRSILHMSFWGLKDHYEAKANTLSSLGKGSVLGRVPALSLCC